MTTLFPMNLTCPVCGEDFKSNGIASHGFASKRTDFRPNYWGFNPMYYFYHLCPHCGFCAKNDDFKKEFNKTTTIKIKIDELGTLKTDTLPKKLERATACLEIMNELGIVNVNSLTLANKWVETYWWAEKEENMIRFGEIAIRYFYDAIEKDQVPEANIFPIKYLMGEINRRIGNEKKAIELFDEVISLTKNIKEFEDISNLAIQQKTNPKEDI